MAEQPEVHPKKIETSAHEDRTVTVGRQMIYPDSRIPPGTIWDMNNTWTISPNHEFVLVAQTDGNLVLYQVYGQPPSGEGAFRGRPLWATDTMGAGRNATFTFQKDGNLVVAGGNNSGWQSNTGGISPADLALEDDGTLKLSERKHVWSTPLR